MSVAAVGVKNRAGYIVDAIRENYHDPELQKQRHRRAEKAKEKALEDLTTEFNAKRNNLLRQAIHANPELVDAAAERIQSYIVRERLIGHPSVMAAYPEGWDDQGGDQCHPCRRVLPGHSRPGCHCL